MTEGSLGDAPLRAATEADIPALAALHAEAFPPAERWGPTALTAMLRLEGGYGLLAEGSGFILARAVAGEAEILTLAVHPAARRRGLGARLLEAAVAEAGRRGAAALFLEVSEANGPARALYARAGAAEVGRRRRYYANGTDALVLRIGPDA